MITSYRRIQEREKKERGGKREKEKGISRHGTSPCTPPCVANERIGGGRKKECQNERKKDGFLFMSLGSRYSHNNRDLAISSNMLKCGKRFSCQPCGKH
jgi:hypothetical protein